MCVCVCVCVCVCEGVRETLVLYAPCVFPSNRVYNQSVAKQTVWMSALGFKLKPERCLALISSPPKAIKALASILL